MGFVWGLAWTTGLWALVTNFAKGITYCIDRRIVG